MSAQRTVIVGAGVIGLSLALELARRGRDVRVVDERRPGSGATGTSFAWLNSNGKTPRPYFELNVLGIAEHRAFAEAARGSWIRLTGNLEWAAPDGQAEVARRVDALREWGYEVHTLTPRQAVELEPAGRFPADGPVWYFPGEAHVVPELLVAHLVDRLGAADVGIMRGRVTHVERHGDAVTGVVLDGGADLAADVVVACAGRWTDDVVRLAGSSVPMLPLVPGTRVSGLLAYARGRSSLRRVLTTPGLNVRPDVDGRLVLQATDFDRLGASAVPPDSGGEVAREILRRGRDRIRDFAADSLEEIRPAARSIPLDGLPAVGWAPGVERLYVVATHSGITLSFALARLAADEIEGLVAPALEPFRPARFASPAGLAGG